MFKAEADNLRQEIEAGITYRDKFLKEREKLIRRYTGRFFRSDKKADQAITENHGYEFLSLMLPSVVYDNPRCRIRAAEPFLMDSGGTQSIGQRAAAMELALNKWSENIELSNPLFDLAVDFYFSWSVFLLTVQDQPGYQGAEMVPQSPYPIHLDPYHFVMDPLARSCNAMQHDGPRFSGHMWTADKDDLLDDDTYDHDKVRALATDVDLDKYYPEREGMQDAPKRGELIAYDIWVPEHQNSDDPAMNGTIYTIAMGASPDGVTKQSAFIRDPRPAYCGPWGPYVLFGAYKVPNSPYPLSPLVATAEQAEEVNAHTTAAANDARAYKRFAYGRTGNVADAQRVQTVPNGHMVLLDDVEGVGQMELGGISQVQQTQMQLSMQRLERVSGLSSAKLGSPGRGTATGESIADAAQNTRTDGMKRQFRKGVTALFRSAAWYMFYGDDIRIRLGEEGRAAGLSEYRGGVYPGMEEWNFFDLSLSIDALSLEHTDQAILQRRMTQAFEILTATAPIMPMTPWVHWREPIRAMFNALNVGEADEWIDFEQLTAATEQAAAGGAGPGAAGGQGAVTSGSHVRGAVGPDPSTQPKHFAPNRNVPAIAAAQERGALAGAAASVV